MATIQIDSKEMADAIRPAVQEALKDIIADIQKTTELKMLGRKDIMRIFHCETAKASKIMSMLPKVEGVGHHCVPEHWLIKWIDENVDWVQEHTGYFGDFEKHDELEAI